VVVIAKSRLRAAWARLPAAEAPLQHWHAATAAADWDTPAAVTATFNTADRVGNCTVFDVGGNNFRLIARVMFRTRTVYVLRVMTHAEYDREDWVDQCGCHRPPPARPKKPKGGPKTNPRPRRKRT
jgi:mRNA interferase HigB